MIEKLNDPDVRKALVKLKGIKNDIGMLLKPVSAIKKYTAAITTIKNKISESELMEFAEFYSDPVNCKDLPESVLNFFKTEMSSPIHEFASLVSTNWDTINEFITEENDNKQSE